MENFESLVSYEETTEGNKAFVSYKESINLSQLIIAAYIEGFSEFYLKFEIPVKLDQYQEMMEIISKLPGFEIASINQNEVLFKDVSDLDKMKGIKSSLFEERLKNLQKSSSK